MTNRFAPLCVLTILVGLLAVSGCDTPPVGHRSGRVDTSVTTDAEVRSTRVLPVALLEFSDQVPQALVQDLADIPAIQELPGRATIVMGDLNNRTGNISSDEFELIRSRVRNSLLQSRYVRDRLRFVESRARMDYLRERELGAAAPSQTQHDPDSAFALNGDFYRIGRRGSVNQYYMEFQLVHFKTNEIVFSKRYDVKQEKP